MQLSIFQVWPKNDRSVIPCFWAKPAERPRHACQLQRSEEGPLETLFAAAQSVRRYSHEGAGSILRHCVMCRPASSISASNTVQAPPQEKGDAIGEGGRDLLLRH